MSQEINAPVKGGVAGRDIVRKSVTNVVHVNFGDNSGGQLVIANEPVHIHMPPATPAPKIKVIIDPGPDCIDDEQKAHLKALVAEVIRLEGLLKRNPRTFGAVWTAVNAKCKASSYHLITQASLPKAEKFLREWIGRLSSAKSAPSKDANWRNRKYSYIFTNVKQLHADDALRAYLKSRFGSESLKGVSDADLDAIYHLVAGWKKLGRAPRQADA
jgi:hypothetical protein